MDQRIEWDPATFQWPQHTALFLQLVMTQWRMRRNAALTWPVTTRVSRRHSTY